MGIAAELAQAIDPVVLARAAGFEPDDWQARLLRSSSPRILLNCSRQSGKSTMCAVAAIHAALYCPGSLTLIVSRAERQSGELMAKAKAIFRALGRPVQAAAESVLQIRLANGSRIVALPGREETIRSYSSVALLLLDEAARIPDPTYYAVRPMLAVSGGRLIALTSAFGRRGWFWEAWSEGGDAWERYLVPAVKCPRISPEFLEEERAALGQWWFAQEYECRFLQPMDSVFSAEAVERAFAPSGVRPLFEHSTGIGGAAAMQPPPGAAQERAIAPLFEAI
jgi:hypothetical protein